MIQLTDFTKVIDTYKKNFDIRNKKFSDKKKKDIKEKREEREKKIESSKIFSLKRTQKKVIGKSEDILDTAIRFAGFTLLGVIVKNLDKIAVFAKQVVEKIKEFAIRFKKYFDDVLVPIFNDIVGLGTQIKDTFGDIANFVIRMNPYNELSDVLETVMSGILALGYRIANLYRPFVKATAPGVTTPERSSARTPEKKPVTTPVRTPSKKPAKIFSRTPVRGPSVLSPRQSRSALRAIARSFSRTLTGTPVGAGVGAPGAPGASGTGVPLTPEQIQAQTLDKAAREALDRTFKALDASKKGVQLPVAPPGTQTGLEQFIRKAQENVKKGKIKDPTIPQFVDPALTEAAGESAKVRYQGGDELIGGEKPPSQQVARARLKGDLLRQGVPMSTGFEDLLRSIETTKPSRFSIENLKKLTQGLDFRFDIGKVLKEQLLNPKNFVKNLGSFGVGLGIDVLVRSLAKYISSILPYDEDFEDLAFIGLIDPDRIHQLTAGKIINLPKEKRRKAIERLERDSKSSDDIFGLGQKKREMASAILKYISIFSGGEITPSVKPKQIPESLINKPDPTIIPKDRGADDEFVYPDGTILRPGMTVGKLNNTSGLDGSTTYGSQGMMISREVVIAIQPVEIG